MTQALSRSEEIYLRLKDEIEAGIWKPEERLPSEGALAGRYQVSRPVLRQALTQLRAEGRIRSRKGAGHYVCDCSKGERIEFGVLRNVPDVRQFLEFRRLIEAEIAAEAARAMTPEALEQIRARLAVYDRAVESGAPSVEEDIAFHLEIARACGNRFLLVTLESLTEQARVATKLNRELSETTLAERLSRVSAEHHGIVEALETGDPERARAVMEAHLTAGIRRLFGS
ncbi:FadR/GntR family transcriptional regulator [Poseidonocella sp. HB161398]|uniref:FadR/GntR family transcriptional regulator n=1 Tax=Poseidonocella sp. HB161398 TaxID=2320855 RepID=UPI001109D472|nr:FCD domain-containing protein [Poseidonocella sp. HB161398]